MKELPALGLYIHIPFCERKCPYCDFNTYAGLETQFADLVTALGDEMGRWRPLLAGRTVSSVFVGGGTPTVLEEAQLAQLFAVLHANFDLAPDCEITCEANPGTVDQAKFGALRRLGVNRLSMGVQSLQPQELAFLGRIHDVADVYRAFDAARGAGFTNINLDFIFGLPHQEPDAWGNTLARALELRPEHLSLYSLIVEPETPLNHWVQAGKVDAPDDDLAADLYELAMAKLSTAGYAQYEVSNWALGGGADAMMPAYACRHNLLYWRNEDYLGIGPGAHSHLHSVAEDGTYHEQRWGNRKPVSGYIKRIRSGAPVEEFREEIDTRLAMGETMMLGLRLLHEGVPGERFARRHGQQLETVFGDELRELAGRDLLTWNQHRVRLTPGGLLLGNRVFAAFLPD
jgi:oxygen-independent coproporphyrinogen-3 oxidase